MDSIKEKMNIKNKPKFKNLINRLSEFRKDMFNFGVQLSALLGFIFASMALIFLRDELDLNIRVIEIAFEMFGYWLGFSIFLSLFVFILRIIHNNPKNWERSKKEEQITKRFIKWWK